MTKNNARKVLTKEGEQHFSVGAIIEKDGKILIMERNLPPEGFACIAGHIDVGETPLDALRREIKEEVGLDLVSCDLILKRKIMQEEDCVSGAKKHLWYVYGARCNGELKPAKREVRSIGYLSKEKIKKLYKQKRLEYAWAVIFKKLRII
ncbi:MAG: NUDIX hydrolase [Candidatus Woesearchaeota archaeon]